jgi:hypothetical protein
MAEKVRKVLSANCTLLTNGADYAGSHKYGLSWKQERCCETVTKTIGPTGRTARLRDEAGDAGDHPVARQASDDIGGRAGKTGGNEFIVLMLARLPDHS